MKVRSDKESSIGQDWAETEETFQTIPTWAGHMCQGVYAQHSCCHDRFLKIYSDSYVDQYQPNVVSNMPFMFIYPWIKV